MYHFWHLSYFLYNTPEHDPDHLRAVTRRVARGLGEGAVKRSG
jgi:hypothetical protein